jgi:hypothetical protein
MLNFRLQPNCALSSGAARLITPLQMILNPTPPPARYAVCQARGCCDIPSQECSDPSQKCSAPNQKRSAPSQSTHQQWEAQHPHPTHAMSKPCMQLHKPRMLHPSQGTHLQQEVQHPTPHTHVQATLQVYRSKVLRPKPCHALPPGRALTCSRKPLRSRAAAATKWPMLVVAACAGEGEPANILLVSQQCGPFYTTNIHFPRCQPPISLSSAPLYFFWMLGCALLSKRAPAGQAQRALAPRQRTPRAPRANHNTTPTPGAHRRQGCITTLCRCHRQGGWPHRQPFPRGSRIVCHCLHQSFPTQLGSRCFSHDSCQITPTFPQDCCASHTVAAPLSATPRCPARHSPLPCDGAAASHRLRIAPCSDPPPPYLLLPTGRTLLAPCSAPHRRFCCSALPLINACATGAIPFVCVFG